MHRLTALLALCAVPVAAQCVTGLSETSVSIPARSSAPDGTYKDSLRVYAPGTCSWAAAPDAAWITISLGGVPTNPSTGNGFTGYSVLPNLTPYVRSGRINIGGMIFTVTQAGANCDIVLTPALANNLPAAGAAGKFDVATKCQWTPVSSAAWVQASGGATGNGTVNYTVSANPSTTPRSATISIYDTVFTISQAGGTCSYAIEPVNANFDAGAGGGAIRLTTLAGCAWTAQSDATWLAVDPQTRAGSGAATINYTVAANTFAVQRSGRISIGGAQFTASQKAAVCSFTLTPANYEAPAAGGQGESVQVATACSWSPAASDGWIQVTSAPAVTGSGTLTFTTGANNTGRPRAGSIQVGTAKLAITQPSLPCDVKLDPAAANVDGNAGDGSVKVAAAAACWTAESFSPWLRVLSSSAIDATGSGQVNYSYDTNPTGEPRTGILRIGQTNFTLTQDGGPPAFTAESVAHGAAARAGAVAPGEIVVIYGLLLGPQELVTYQVTEDGLGITKALAGTRVLFNGEPAPMIYTLAGQVSCIVPWSAAKLKSVAVVVEYQGRKSRAVTLPVALAAPGIFTIDKSGAGAGAILNEDNQLNANVAAGRGSIVQVFLTGGGVTTPLPADGAVTLPPLPQLDAKVDVLIDGQAADLIFAGPAPYQVAGMLQVNARIPQQARGGRVPIQVRVGGQLSRAGVTVNVQ